MPKACPICGNLKDNRTHSAREMMFGTRDPFEYMECGSCGTLSLINVPDLSRYYPKDYYSLETDEPVPFPRLRTRIAERLIGRYYVTRRGLVGRYLSRKRPFIAGKFPPWLLDAPSRISRDASILDLGSGNGKLLRTLASLGFRKLTGADAYIEKDLDHDGVKIYKRHLAELDGKYDVIMLHHSFEHLPDPESSLRHIDRLLDANGTVLIRIPVVNYAWEKYGVNWVQLDPPRHLFLYTERAFRMLADRAGFEVVKVVYDSEAFQFHGSEQYAMDIPINDPRTFSGATESSIFTKEQYDEWVRMAAELNSTGRGDQACFYLKNKKTT